MADKLKLLIIGLGGRGTNVMWSTLIDMLGDKLEVVAVSDLYEDRMKAAADIVEEKCGTRPVCIANYKEAVKLPEVEAVLVTAAWEEHINACIAAMKAGKYVGMEVGGAYAVEDCWELVRTYEETGVHCMLIENCCYGQRELMALNMVRQGLFGDVVHCSGGYMHDLRDEISGGKENRHYRLRNYMNRNCENYPTHELCPIGKILNINNGNRFMTVSATASCAKGLHEYIVDRRGADDPLAKVEFAQGDIFTTVIKCAKGQTVVLTLDTTLPRYYSRDFTVRGTKGSYFELNDSVYLDKGTDEHFWSGKEFWGNAEEYAKEYDHPLWKDYDPQGGHGGMDYLVYDAFIEAARANKRPPLDVYDAATYMCVTALSELSVNLGGAPVNFPDFTRGQWYKRRDIEDGVYNLDIVDMNEDILNKI